MDSPQKREFASWKSANAWIVNETGILPSMVVDSQASPTVPTAFGTQVTAFQSVIANLTVAAATQNEQQGTAMGTTATAVSLRSDLWDVHMKPIAQVARAVIADIPSAAPALRLPNASIDQQGLLSAATAMATQAANYEQVLITNGLPSDFIAQLQGATAALDQAFTARRQALATRKGATATVAEQFALGRTALGLINTMLVRLFGSGSVTLAAWDSAKRVTAGPSSSSTPAASVNATTTTMTETAGATAQATPAEEHVNVPAGAEVRAA